MSCLNNFDLFKIRIFDDVHSFQLSERAITQVQATTTFVSGITAPKLVNHIRKYTPGDIIEEMKT